MAAHFPATANREAPHQSLPPNLDAALASANRKRDTPRRSLTPSAALEILAEVDIFFSPAPHCFSTHAIMSSGQLQAKTSGDFYWSKDEVRARSPTRPSHSRPTPLPSLAFSKGRKDLPQCLASLGRPRRREKTNLCRNMKKQRLFFPSLTFVLRHPRNLTLTPSISPPHIDPAKHITYPFPGLTLPAQEPHAKRRREILAKYPQIKELYGPDWTTCPQIFAVVSAQLCLAVYLGNHASWG